MKSTKLIACSLMAVLGAFAPAANAATPISGELYYTTFQTQSNGPGPNVYCIHFSSDGIAVLTLSDDHLVASLHGADGLIFDPNDASGKTLIVGEQNANRVAGQTVDGTINCVPGGTVINKADKNNAFGVGLGQ